MVRGLFRVAQLFPDSGVLFFEIGCSAKLGDREIGVVGFQIQARELGARGDIARLGFNNFQILFDRAGVVARLSVEIAQADARSKEIRDSQRCSL